MKHKKEGKKSPIIENYNLYKSPVGSIYYLIKPDSYYFPIFCKSKVFVDTGDREELVKVYEKIEIKRELIELKE